MAVGFQELALSMLKTRQRPHPGTKFDAIFHFSAQWVLVPWVTLFLKGQDILLKLR